MVEIIVGALLLIMRKYTPSGQRDTRFCTTDLRLCRVIVALRTFFCPLRVVIALQTFIYYTNCKLELQP